jgi:hypothetical protein
VNRQQLLCPLTLRSSIGTQPQADVSRLHRLPHRPYLIVTPRMWRWVQPYFPKSTLGTLGTACAVVVTETTEGKEQPISRRCRMPYLMSRRRKVRRHRVRCRLKG